MPDAVIYTRFLFTSASDKFKNRAPKNTALSATANLHQCVESVHAVDVAENVSSSTGMSSCSAPLVKCLFWIAPLLIFSLVTASSAIFSVVIDASAIPPCDTPAIWLCTFSIASCTLSALTAVVFSKPTFLAAVASPSS